MAITTMGRKHTVPCGLYLAHGFVSSFLVEQTGFSEDDLELLWQALAQMFERVQVQRRGGVEPSPGGTGARTATACPMALS